MSTPLAPDPNTEPTPPPGPGTKTLCVKNVPHAVWQRARQNALASNLSFGDYVVKLLNTAGPFVPPAQSGWDALTGSCPADEISQPRVLNTHHSPGTSPETPVSTG